MKFLKFLAVLLLSLATPALAPTPAPAQHLASHGPPVAMPLVSTATAAVAIRAPAAPVLDGRDNDPAWEEAQVIQGFRMSDPIEDGAERFHTVARIAYDAHALYVLVRAFDPHPDSIVALLSRRDVSTPSDQIEVMIDSYHDRRTGYEFAVNPSGVQRDYAITNDGETDDSWDGIWQVATATDSLGWVAEFRIPFGQLRFGRSASHTFGLMIIRTIARTNERMS
jgi:hypothetical protein